MKSLLEYYMYMIQSERESFWDYIELINYEPDKNRRSIWLEIAKDELDHFSQWVDVIGKDQNDTSEMERAFYSLLNEEKERMQRTVVKYK